MPPHEDPVHGFVLCEHPTLGVVIGDDMRMGTVCTFECSDSAEMLGSPTSECLQDFGPIGAWSSEAPICQRECQTLQVVPFASPR